VFLDLRHTHALAGDSCTQEYPVNCVSAPYRSPLITHRISLRKTRHLIGHHFNPPLSFISSLLTFMSFANLDLMRAMVIPPF